MWFKASKKWILGAWPREDAMPGPPPVFPPELPLEPKQQHTGCDFTSSSQPSHGPQMLCNCSSAR